jgi:Mycothiol maleylpyruvate isomerase N-terminal domain
MGADRSYIEENEAELRRLRELLDGLSEEQLGTPMDAGWTAAAVLAHVAFWDYRVVTLLEQWGPDGDGPQPTDPEDAVVHWINDANKPIFLAIPPRTAAAIALDAAKAADRAVAEMSDDLLAKAEQADWVIYPVRAEHRREHVDELAALFASPS